MRAGRPAAAPPAPEVEQDMGAALQQVKDKLGTSLAAPERPLFDLGVGLNAEFDTAELSLVVRGVHAQPAGCVTGHLRVHS